MRYLALVALAVSACATEIPADQASNWQVCESTMGGRYAQAAEAERQRRGLDCAPLYPAILAQRQQRAQALKNAADYFNRPAPALSPPQQTNCTSRAVGNTIQTSCW